MLQEKEVDSGAGAAVVVIAGGNGSDAVLLEARLGPTIILDTFEGRKRGLFLTQVRINFCFTPSDCEAPLPRDFLHTCSHHLVCLFCWAGSGQPTWRCTEAVVVPRV